MVNNRDTEVKAKETKFKKKDLFKPASEAKKAIPAKLQNITKEKLLEFMPRGVNAAVTNEVIDMINRMEDDTGLPQELMEEEVLSYMYILKKVNRTSVKELVNAVKFCNLKRNMTNEQAWKIVFPDKADKLTSEGRQIASHVAMYNQSALVTEIDKEMLIPFYVQYAPYAHAAVKKQYELMNGRSAPNADGEPMTVSPMVQMLAAKALLETTKMPETAQIDLTINKSSEEMSMQQEMNQQLKELVKIQKQRLTDGEDISSVQKININLNDVVEAEVYE